MYVQDIARYEQTGTTIETVPTLRVDVGWRWMLILFPEPIFYLNMPGPENLGETYRELESAQQFVAAMFWSNISSGESHRHAERVKQGPQSGHWHLWKSNVKWIEVDVTDVSWLMGKI